ncbi:MAG: FtsH protease activity modulator HflK [Candidatus Omnitrophota bacterium]
MIILNKDNEFQELKKKVTPRFLGILIFGILLFVAIFTSFFMVDQKETAVILQFGKFHRMAGPGLHVKLPFGMEKAYKVPTGRNLIEEFGFRTEEAGIISRFSKEDFSTESYMLTGDLNIAEVTWSIQYQIRDPKAWLFNMEDQQKSIRDVSRAVINVLVGDMAVFDVVTTLRTQIQEKGKVTMNDILNKWGLGVQVLEVKLQKTMYPKGAVQDAFEDVNKAIQDRIRFVNEGKEAYNKEIPRARGEAQQVIREAEGYAVERVNLAKGDVARFLAVLGEYKKNPQVIRTRLYYEMMDEVFSQTDSIELIDKQLKNFIPFKSLSDSNPTPSPKSKKGGQK